MSDHWFIRVDGKEYGPADLDTLREWKAEGRVLPSNEVRPADSPTWDKAEKIAGLFETRPVSPVQKAATPTIRTVVSTRKILPETFVIYTRGFFKYLGLTLLVQGPAVCAQLTAAFVERSPSASSPDAATLVAIAFNICMFVLGLVLTPIYIAGIQILTASYAAGESMSLLAVLNEAVKFWPRMAGLCVIVFVLYLLANLPLLLIVPVALSGVSVLSIFLVLLATSGVVWLVGRLWINFMFWQQFAVLEGSPPLEALRRSRELARSGKNLRWYRRPLWRGVFIASIWFAIVLALNWPTVSEVFRMAGHAADPKAMMDEWNNVAKTAGSAPSAFAANVLQAILKPLLGIAFVLLFLDANMSANAE